MHLPQSKILSLATAMILMASWCGFAQENYTTWGHNTDLIINTSPTGYNTTTNVANFPYLVKLTANNFDFTQALSKGQDVRFANSTGTHLPYQIESWDATGKKAFVWVKVDAILGNNATQYIRMYFGSAGAADSSNKNAVFSTADHFAAVWHFSGADSMSDATSNSQTLTNSKSTPVSSSVIGAGRNLNATLGNTYLKTADSMTLNMTTAVTMSAWLKTVDASVDQKVLGKVAWSNGTIPTRGYLLGINSTGSGVNPEIWDTTGSDAKNAGGSLVSNVWAHVAVTYTAGGQYVSYLNGVPVKTSNVGATPIGSCTNVFYIGCPGWSQNALLYNGEIDEVEISGVARSADWIKLAYANERFVPDSAPAIAYPAPAYTFQAATMITPQIPTITGYFDSLTITPALPQGHAFNARTGAITGYSFTAFAATPYYVSAINEKGTGRDTLTLTCQDGSGTPENYSQWQTNESIAINTAASGYNIGSTVVNFPYLVRLDSTFNFSQAKAGGADIRFARGATHLPYQIDQWNTAARTATIWVKIDTIKASDSTQSITMYWNNAAATDMSNGYVTFSPLDGYAAAYHFSPQDTFADATINGLRLTNNKTTASATGLIGGSRNWNGGNDIDLHVNDNPLLNLTQNQSMSAWVKPTDPTGDHSVCGKSTYPLSGYVMGVNNNAIDAEYAFSDGTNHRPSGGKIQADRWAYLTVTWKTGDSIRAYVNGVPVNALSAGTSPLGTNANPFYLGRTGWDNSGKEWHGDIDEVEVASVVHSADWIRLSYLNQRVLPTVAPTITYPSKDIYVQPLTFLTPVVPTITGEFDSITITPFIDGGLTFDNATGTIAGSAGEQLMTTVYYISIYNAVGHVTDTVTVTIDNTGAHNGKKAVGVLKLMGFVRSTAPQILFSVPADKKYSDFSFQLYNLKGTAVWSSRLGGNQLRSGVQAVGIDKLIAPGMYFIEMKARSVGAQSPVIQRVKAIIR
jgi:hypothetical protein